MEMEFLESTYFWFNISFAIFVVIAYKFGKGAILGLLDGRIESIRKEIESAESLRVEAQELLAQYQRKHKDAVKDAQAIVANAEKQAAEIQKKAEDDLEETIARREKQLQERLSRMEQAAAEEIRQRAASLALEATAEIIAAELDKKTNEKLVDASIKGIAGNLH
jgi:F-type H+-transporting ATPase subunit b